MAIKYLDAKRIRGSSTASNITTPTHDINYSSNSGWTQVNGDGSHGNITVSNGKVEGGSGTNASSTGVEMGTARVHYDLSSDISDTAWIVDFEYHIIDATTNCHWMPFVLTETNAKPASDVSHTSIQFQTYENSGAGTYVMRLRTYDNSATQSSSSDYGTQLAEDTTYYMRLNRSSATSLTLSVYTDSARTTLLGTAITQTIPSTLDGLQFLQHCSTPSSSTGSNDCSIWTIDNTKIYSGVASALSDEKATLITDGWTVTDSASGTDFRHNNNELQLKATNNAANSGSLAIHDVGDGVVSSTEWILRWKWHIISRTGAGGSPQTIGFGLSSGTDTAGSAGSGGGTWSPAEGVAGIFASTESSQWYFQQFTGTAATNVYTSTDRNNTATNPNFTNTTYYCQLRRYSNSGTDTIEAKLYSDSGYSSEVSSTGSTETSNMPANLRYIKAEVWQHSVNNQANSLDTVIDDVKFWNGTSTSGTPTYETDFTSIAADGPPENTLFEETDTYKTYWLQDGAWAINPLPFSSAGSSGFICGGSTSGSGTPTTASQQYNGSTWSDMSSIPSAYTIGQGGGNATAAFAAGGSDSVSGQMGTNPINTNYLWNGSAWSTGNNLSASRNMGAGGGNTSSALIWGGTYSQLASSDEFDGTNWSAGGNLLSGTGLRGMNGDGKNSSNALSVGGYNGSSAVTTTQQYDGTSWTAATAAIGSTAVQSDHGGCGTKTSFLSATNSTSAGTIDYYNGTTWSTTASTVGDRRSIYGGDGTKAFKASGDNVGDTHSEYFDGSTWASTGNMETSVRMPKGAGGNT